LLFWVGDYPGIAKPAMMKHQGCYGCHWCWGFFYSHSPGNNVCIHNRRSLRLNHPFRKDSRWGAHEPRTQVPLRSAAEMEALGKEIDAMEANPAKERKKTSTGINGFCMLIMLSMFDPVWDMMPDMMHIVKGITKPI
jgi:hypothetical protein